MKGPAASTPASPLWPAQLDERLVAELVARLCSWFDEHCRDLPWRQNRDPYSIWISEAMLQQTRVATVLEYHPRFLAALPSVKHLAEAPEESVLALWSGLGYYRRARSLQAAAKLIMEQHAGRFPREYAAFLALPGVGPYTAGAVLSIAFQQGQALVDGNVSRVFSRLFGLRAEVSSPAAQRLCWSIARHMVPASLSISDEQQVPRLSPGNWNQALMELGAMVCTPQKPECDCCPLADECVALAAGLTDELPLKLKKARPVQVAIEVLLLRDGERFLLSRRPAGGRMEGLWELPTRELPAVGGSHFGLWPEASGLGAFCAELERGEDLGELSHSITKHRIRGRLFEARLNTPGPLPKDLELRWVALPECEQLGITGLTRKCLLLADL